MMKRLCVALIVSASVSAPAFGLRDTTQARITTSDGSRMVAVFGTHEGNPDGMPAESGHCTMHWGVLSLANDGSALLQTDVSSLDTSAKWQGRLLLLDQEGKTVGTLPASGTFTIEIRELRPRRVTMTIPMTFSPESFAKIRSVRMNMEC